MPIRSLGGTINVMNNCLDKEKSSSFSPGQWFNAVNDKILLSILRRNRDSKLKRLKDCFEGCSIVMGITGCHLQKNRIELILFIISVKPVCRCQVT